ncbi:MAG: TRAM domain-containing protein [Candidatus Omnitrophica bacterium]|nr:TRAM domain-containing protein [Candidatus Omnitrophota bacterium]
MSLWIVRLFFVAAFSVIGYQSGCQFNNALLGVAVAFVFSSFIVFFETLTRKISLRGLSSAVFGLIFGLLFAKILSDIISLFPLDQQILLIIKTALILTFSYIGMVLGLRGRDEFHLIIPYVKFKRQSQSADIVLVDTSAIIDGRILDIIKTGFVDARLLVPRFILKELQLISDSTDPIKRQRGQRGLEILRNLQSIPGIEVRIHEQEPEGKMDTDAKLVRLAQLMDAKVMTTDFNLNRVAEIEGIKVLNINELARALKPVFLPGEEMSIKLVREGKEHSQAVGYLEDGTMVVVESARWLIGKTVKVQVTSVLQNPSGRIIFARLVS